MNKLKLIFRLLIITLLLAVAVALFACGSTELPPDSWLNSHSDGVTKALTPSEGTVTPVPTATDAPDATKAPTATDAPDATKAPTATEASEATKTPTATEAPDATKAPTATVAPTSAPLPTVEPTTVSLLAAGDNLLHYKVILAGIKDNGTINYDHFYRFCKEDISSADIAVINQETVLGGTHYEYAGYPKFNSPTEIGDAVIAAGFDVVLHANNHITDYGIEGLLYTLDYWDTHPEIKVLGIQRTLEEYSEIDVIEKNGIKIAMLNYTYGLNVGSEGKYYMIDSFDYAKAEQDIKKAKEMADFVIVFPHWGDEYVYEPNEEQLAWTKFFSNLGVDLVIGNHAHVLQPIEWVENEKGHRMLVYYSIGNYISSMDYTNTMLGILAKVTITKDETGTYISDASATPIVTHYEPGCPYNFGVYKLSEYNEELAAVHFIHRDYRGNDITWKLLKQIAANVLGDWYTKD